MAIAQLLDTEQKTRVLLIDENPIFLKTAAGFLKRQKGMVVLRTSPTLESALIGARDFGPSVIVLDPSSLGSAGLASIARLRRISPAVRIIVMALVDSPTYRDACLGAGADDFVAKSDIVSELLPAIRRTASLSLGDMDQRL
jgi:DNA-binding NarL/FixJ family response regulator